LDRVLLEWEQKTAGIKYYQCEFERYDLSQDAVLAQRNIHTSFAKGQIKFMAPDKGLFRVDEMKSIADKGAVKPQFRANPLKKFGEFWICDGAWVHILDRNAKTAVRTELPPELRGKQIYLSPLPFLFGVKAEEVKRRYWIRPIRPPAGDNNSRWLEAWPKRLDDAGSYSRVQIVLDSKDMLPKSLIVFKPNFELGKSPLREVYEFKKRKVGQSLFNKLWRRDFINTNLPSDWTVTREPYIPPQEAAGPGQGRPISTPPRMAQPPARQPVNR